MVAVDALHEGGDLGRLQVVDGQGDAGATGLGDLLGGLLDGLGPVVVGACLPGGAAGAVHDGSGGPQLDGDAPPGASGGARHQGDPSGERAVAVSFAHGTRVAPPP